MFKKGDFHIHSNASDGKYTPKEIAHLAFKNNVDIFALTDHDTTLGTDEAVAEGKELKIKVIRGIELSTLYNKETVHVLGYFRDDSYKNSKFQDFLKEMSVKRESRGEEIVNNLDKLYGIKLDYEKVLASSNGIVARPHIAKAIMDEGYPYTWDYIFSDLIGGYCPAFVPTKKIFVEEGIELLKSVNAVTVLAHPVLLKKSKPQELIKFPFDGIEAIYFRNNAADTRILKDLANKNNLAIFGGSDFHGIDKEDSGHSPEVGTIWLNDYEINNILKLGL